MFRFTLLFAAIIGAVTCQWISHIDEQYPSKEHRIVKRQTSAPTPTTVHYGLGNPAASKYI